MKRGRGQPLCEQFVRSSWWSTITLAFGLDAPCRCKLLQSRRWTALTVPSCGIWKVDSIVVVLPGWVSNNWAWVRDLSQPLAVSMNIQSRD